MMTTAKVIKDSISPDGHRVTTIEATMHRFVLAEFNTHRVFSRNSASSRAIPYRKQVERVIDDPAVPLSFPAEQRGMQGGDELDDARRDAAVRQWLEARDLAVQSADALADLGVHKSVVNRLLEPFMWHTVIVTATDWTNFFGLRCSPLAQPEIRVVADNIRSAYEASKPDAVDYGAWHLPYIDMSDYITAGERFNTDKVTTAGAGYYTTELLKRVSSARCARVSYLTHDGQRNIDKDLELFYRLSSADPMHASPMEHVATPADNARGNFVGWRQFRHELEA